MVHKFRHRSTRLCVRKEVYQIQSNNAMQRPLRRSRLFKVTDFCSNGKLIYDFLLVIRPNTNLPPILHRFHFQVMADYSWFSLARGECLTLTLSWCDPLPISLYINDISLKLDSLAYIFAAESIGVSSTTFT